MSICKALISLIGLLLLLTILCSFQVESRAVHQVSSSLRRLLEVLRWSWIRRTLDICRQLELIVSTLAKADAMLKIKTTTISHLKIFWASERATFFSPCTVYLTTLSTNEIKTENRTKPKSLHHDWDNSRCRTNTNPFLLLLSRFCSFLSFNSLLCITMKGNGLNFVLFWKISKNQRKSSNKSMRRKSYEIYSK